MKYCLSKITPLTVIYLIYKFVTGMAQKATTKVKKTGLFIASLTIVNTIIGGGIVAMPFASYNLGLLAGNILFSNRKN